MEAFCSQGVGDKQDRGGPQACQGPSWAYPLFCPLCYRWQPKERTIIAHDQRGKECPLPNPWIGGRLQERNKKPFSTGQVFPTK